MKQAYDYEYTRQSVNRYELLKINIAAVVLLTLFLVVSLLTKANISLVMVTITYMLSIIAKFEDILRNIRHAEIGLASLKRIEYMEYFVNKNDTQALPEVKIEPTCENALEVKNLACHYGDGNYIVRDCNFAIKRGEHVLIQGKSGIGKTTLFNCFERLIDYEGTILFFGIDIRNVTPEIIRERMFILTQNSLVFNGSIKENLDPYDCYSKEKIEDSLKRFHLDKYSVDTECNQLSEGEKQLLCLVRAHLKQPLVLLIDEGMDSLDSAIKRTISELIHSEFKNCTIVSISHLGNEMNYEGKIVLHNYEGKMKSALIFLPDWNTTHPYLSIPCLTAYLKENGVEVRQIDLNIEWFWYTCTDSFLDACYENISNKEMSEDSRILYEMLYKYLKAEKESFKTGIKKCEEFYSYEGYKILRNFVEILQAFASMAYDGYQTDSGIEQCILSIEDLPVPDFEDLSLELYTAPERILPYYVSRSCYWGKCAFCDHDYGYDGKYRVKSVEKVLSDIVQLKKKYNANVIYFVDEALNIPFLEKMCDSINEENKFYWFAYIKASTKFTYELCCKLKRSGCLFLMVGIESCSNEMLKKMNKGITVEDIHTTVENMDKAGVWLHSFMINDFPTERLENKLETIFDVFSYPFHSIGLSQFSLPKNAKISSNLDEYGLYDLKEKSDLSSIMDYKASIMPDRKMHKKIIDLYKYRDYNRFMYNFLMDSQHMPLFAKKYDFIRRKQEFCDFLSKELRYDNKNLIWEEKEDGLIVFSILNRNMLELPVYYKNILMKCTGITDTELSSIIEIYSEDVTEYDEIYYVMKLLF